MCVTRLPVKMALRFRYVPAGTVLMLKMLIVHAGMAVLLRLVCAGMFATFRQVRRHEKPHSARYAERWKTTAIDVRRRRLMLEELRLPVDESGDQLRTRDAVDFWSLAGNPRYVSPHRIRVFRIKPTTAQAAMT